MAIKYTEEQLNTLDKTFLVQMYLNLQEQLEALTKETHELNKKIQLMMEQIVLNQQARFGRSSEKMADAGRICFREVDGTNLFFNEAEAISDMTVPEPEDLEVTPTRVVKPAGRKEEHISGLQVNRIDGRRAYTGIRRKQLEAASGRSDETLPFCPRKGRGG